MQNIETFIGLGSNLQDPRTQVICALGELAQIPKSSLLTHSSLYISKPMGQPNQSNYVNAIAKLSTKLEPHILLDRLQEIEHLHRRERGLERWGPRTLDLDIILFGVEKISTDRLQVPHPGLAEREFVLIPLQEIQPDLIIPDRGELCNLIDQLPDYQMTKILIQDVKSQS